MRPNPKFSAIIHKGKIDIEDKEGYNCYLNGNFNDGDRVLVQVTKPRKGRTLNQNSYYWFYIHVIAAETGDTEDDLHEFFKRKFLRPRQVKVLGNEIKLPESTTRLNTNDFSEYMDKITALTGITPPIPEYEL